MKLEEKLHPDGHLGLNGQKLAKISQVSDSEISRILAGKSRPGLENAFRLARAVGVSLDYLADDTLESDPLQNADPLTAERTSARSRARDRHPTRIRSSTIVRIVGYEVAMRRLLEPGRSSRPDPEPRPARSGPGCRPPGRAGSA